MKPILDAVIPVLLPSEYLNNMLTIQDQEDSDFLQIQYVFDFIRIQGASTSGEETRFNYQIPIVKGSFGSPGKARNSAFTVCTSKYICFWDVDDEPQVDQVKKLLFLMDETGAQVGIGNWSVFGKEKLQKGVSPLSVGISPGLWRFIFLRDFINGISFSDFKWGEDQLFVAEVFSRNPQIVTIPETTYLYRNNVLGSLTSDNSHAEDLIMVLNRTASLMNNAKNSTRLCLEIMVLKQLYSIYKYLGIKQGMSCLMMVLFRVKRNFSLFGIIKMLLKPSKSW